MNTFRYISAPCLICRRMPPGAAHGITPQQAVCDPCWIDKHQQALDSLDAVSTTETVAPAADLGSLSVDDVLAAVRAGEMDAGSALAAERGGKNRVSLIRELKKLQGKK